MEDIASVLARASSVTRAAAEAKFLSSIHLVWVAQVVVRATEHCGLLDRVRELQEAIDLLANADLQSMANAAAMVSSAAARTALEAERQRVDLVGICRDLEEAARELSLAVAVAAAAAMADSKSRDDNTCKWICWRKKDARGAEEPGDSGLGQALLQHKAWPASKSASPVLAGSPRLENPGEYIGYALFGSLTLLPYLDPAGPVMKTLSDNGQLTFHIVFSLVWSSVGLGVACMNCRDSASMLLFADAASHIGMAGITALVIWFSHVLIAPKYPAISYLILGFACILQILAWAWDRKWIRYRG